MSSRLKIYFDGGCRPNPGTMEIATVAAGCEQIRRDLGLGTSMEAEWLALIEALTVARALGAEDLVLLGDAAAVIEQANGMVRCPKAARDQFDRYRALSNEVGRFRLRRIKRAQNLAGIALARLHPR